MKTRTLILLISLASQPAFGGWFCNWFTGRAAAPIAQASSPEREAPFVTDHSLATPISVDAFSQTYAESGLIRAATQVRGYATAGDGTLRAFLVKGAGASTEVVIGVAVTRYSVDQPRHLHWLHITTVDGQVFMIPYQDVILYTRNPLP